MASKVMALQHQDSSPVFQYNGNSLRGDDRKNTFTITTFNQHLWGNKQRKSLLQSRHTENTDISELRKRYKDDTGHITSHSIVRTAIQKTQISG
jgi:hypothetical protein